MEIEYNTIADDSGNVMQVSYADKTAIVHARNDLVEHPIMGTATAALIAQVDASMQFLAAKRHDLKDEAFNRVVDSEVSRIANAQRRMREAVLEGRSNLAEKNERVLRPFFPEYVTDAVKVELRAHTKTLNISDLMDAVKRDPVLLSAVVEGGQGLMPHIPADIWAAILDEQRIAWTKAMHQQSGQFLTVPTLDDPVGGMVDEAASTEHAEMLIQQLRDEADVLEAGKQLLSGVVTLVAILKGSTAQTALNALTATVEA